MSYRDPSANDFGGQDQSGADGYSFDGGPQFDPERGVVYPEASGDLASQDPIVERIANPFGRKGFEIAVTEINIFFVDTFVFVPEIRKRGIILYFHRLSIGHFTARAYFPR